MLMNDNLKFKLENLPSSPGVYQFKDENNKIIYVGKAKNLKTRVRSYFNANVDSPKTLALRKKINDIEIIATESEIEALILENNLIKELQPKYNINLKDDKSYPFIKVSSEDFPRIFSTRDVLNDGSKYFGPFVEVKNMKNSLRLVSSLFKLRSCSLPLTEENISKKKFKVCLDYHIKKCDGPCEGLISREDYNKQVTSAVKILEGKVDELVRDLEIEMKKAAEKLEFEKAAEIRDKIFKLKIYSEKQRIVSNDFSNRDIFAVAKEEKEAACAIFIVRNGKLIGKRQLILKIGKDDEIRDVYSSALKFYYSNPVEIPPEIILEYLPEDYNVLSEWLQNKGNLKSPIIFATPDVTEEMQGVFKLCKNNAELQLGELLLQKMKKDEIVPKHLLSLKRDLRLSKLPKRIECFDISNLQGTDAVASMVVFENGKPKKSDYKKFIIKSVEGPNDFASMQEVIFRRYNRALIENDRLPDLIMVDGGKGQLNAALEILNRLNINIPIIGLAKRLEEIYFPELEDPQTLPKTSSSLKLLQYIRDEAHRFAINFHRTKRTKRIIKTELIEIKGIGQKLAEKLLNEFGSVEDIKNADIEKLSQVVGKKKAKAIKEYFKASN